MGNCSHRAVSDGGSGTGIQKDSRNVEVSKTGRNMMDEYYSREKTLAVRQSTRSPKRVGPKIQVSPQRRNGVWKAKVVIGSKQLEEILAVEGNTHALIDQLRFAAAEAEMVGLRNLSRKNSDKYFC